MSKPFNLADAKAGHPVATSNDASITVLKWDYRYPQEEPKIFGIYNDGPYDLPIYWNQNGTLFGGSTSAGTLVMAPLGTVDGCEVYPGDMLSHCGGEASPVPYGVPFYASEWSWPKQYPATRMNYDDMAKIPRGAAPYEQHYAIANAAIAHGIENGYLIDAEGDPDAAIKRGRILAEIAGILGWTTPYVYADIPDGLRNTISLQKKAIDALTRILSSNPQREVDIARHFYMHPGYGSNETVSGLAMPPAEFFTAELTKVK